MQGILFNRFNQVKELVGSYEYPENAALHLSRYLKKNKKLGSKDRRQLKQWYYAYFKLAIFGESLDEILWKTLHADENESLDFLRSISTFESTGADKTVFPLEEKISKHLENKVRENIIAEKPIWTYGTKPKQPYLKRYNNLLWAYPQGTNLPKDNITQDLASFQISEKVATILEKGMQGKEVYRFWDACCGAGGKSLMLTELLGDMPSAWLMSDKRKNILTNAKSRFSTQLKQRLQFAEIDLRDTNKEISDSLLKKGQQFWDVILIDAPCSGSGTWGRNPQHLRHFDSDKLAYYLQLQQDVVKGAEPFLSENGVFIYSTCSVYEDENENQVQWMKDTLSLKLIETQYLGNELSDSMFIAIFER